MGVEFAQRLDVSDEMLGVLWRYRGRIADPSKRPEGSRPIQVAVFGYPVER